jgi:hypothetical protein
VNITTGKRIAIANTLLPSRTAYARFSLENLCDVIWGKQATDWMIPMFWGICRKYHGGVFAEIGTRGGITTTALGMAARDVGGRVYTMDISAEFADDAVSNVQMADCAPYVTFITADSSATDFPEPLDVLFIDGDHTYEGVKADFLRHEPNVKKGGVILFHDPCVYDGIQYFMKEIGAYVIPIEAGLGIYTKGPHIPAGVLRRVA